MSSPIPDSHTRHDAEVIGLVGLAHGTSHFFHLVLPPLFPWLMRDFSLSYTEVGLLTTAFFVVSGVGQALAGFVVDRIGARPVLLFGVGTLALSGIVLGVANSYATLLLAAATAGAGNSIFHPADFTLLNQRVAPRRLGHAFSVHGVSGNIGWASAPVVMAGIASVAGWQAAGFTAAAVGAAVFGILWLRRGQLGEAPATAVLIASERSGGSASESAPLAFLGVGAVWLCFVFFFLTTAAWGILQNYAPPILSQVYGVSLVLANGGLTAYLLGSASGMIAGGFVAARVGEHSERLIAAALAFGALMAMVLASGAPPAAALLPLMAGMGFGVGMSGPGRDLLVRRAATSRFGPTSFGRIYGFVYSGLDTGLAISPVLFGPLLDAGRYRDALIAVAVLQVMCLFTALRVGTSARDAAPAREALGTAP